MQLSGSKTLGICSRCKSRYAEVQLPSGKPVSDAIQIVVKEVLNSAENAVEDITKEDVGMVFTVACIYNNSVIGLSGKVTFSIPAPEQDLEGFVLVYVKENGQSLEIPFELVDGKIVFDTTHIGLYMLIKK